MRVHFIGIGGIGMSALAQYYLAKGHKVSGSDLTRSEITDLLRAKGAEVFFKNPKPEPSTKIVLWPKIKNQKLQVKIQNSDLVIYTPAVKKNNRELLAAKRCNIRTMSYPQALGELTKQYFTIAICGTHGKSTTTAMLALILIKAGLNPTVILGTKLSEFGGSNFRMGGIPKSKTLFVAPRQLVQQAALNMKPKLLVIEADEHFASFLNYWPKMIVLTNIEEDHLDYYKNISNIIRAFREFIGHLPRNGTFVLNADSRKLKIENKKLKTQIKNKKIKTVHYSLKQPVAKELREILRIPGEHNVANALAAFCAARALGIPDKIALKVLSEYRGAWRRFEIIRLAVGSWQLIVISDYAHHPTEIKATIRAAREKFPGKKIWAVFQPHQIARTVALFDDFVKAFDEADAVVLTKIFEVAGREEKRPPKGKDARSLAAKIKKRRPETYFVSDFRKIPHFLKKRAGRGDVILIMGAGDIYLIGSSKYWEK